MESIRSTSSSTADGPAPGDLVAGRYLLERALESSASVRRYRARQVTLERDVDLAFYDPADDEAARKSGALQSALDHAAVPSVLDAGQSPFGAYVAIQAVEGTSLSAIRGRVAIRPALEDVRSALAAAHAAGLVHGALDDASILVQRDGRGSVSGFRPSRGALEAAGDDAALGRIAAAWEPRDAPPRSRRRSAVAGTAVAALAAAVAIALSAADRPGRGTIVIGSALRGGPIRTVGCDGRPVSVNSPNCTIAQFGSTGQRLAAPRDGRVVAWTAEGTRGDIAFQVFRRYRGVWVAAYTGDAVPASGTRHPMSLPVRRGDRFALLLGAGSGAGVSARRGARTGTWTDPLSGRPRPAASGPAGELALRVEFDGSAGAGARGETGVTGVAAKRAPAGTPIAALYTDTTSGLTRRVVLVVSHRVVFADLFSGAVRLARLRLPDAEPGGFPTTFHSVQHPGELELHWSQPSGAPVLVVFLTAHAKTIARGFSASLSTEIPARPPGAVTLPTDKSAF